MSEVKREDLIKAAKELNDVLGLEPQIKTGKKVTDKELIDQLLEAADLILPEDDISDETMKVVKILKGETVEEDDDEIEEEEDSEIDEEEVKDEVDEPKKTKSETKKGNASKNGRSKSNKAIVYEAWKSNVTDIKELAARVNNRVKESTIRTWIAQWKKGKNLPAIAKKG